MPGSQSFKIPYIVFEVKVWWDEVKVDFIGQREESCAKRREVKCGARRPDVVSTRVNLEHHQVSNLCLDQPQFLRPPIPRYFRWRSSSRQNRLLCHKLGNWSQWCWSRQSRNPGRPCTRSLKSWSAIPPCKSLTSAILGHRGGRSARKGDNSKIPGKFIFFLFNCFCKNSPITRLVLNFVNSDEPICPFCRKILLIYVWHDYISPPSLSLMSDTILMKSQSWAIMSLLCFTMMARVLWKTMICATTHPTCMGWSPWFASWWLNKSCWPQPCGRWSAASSSSEITQNKNEKKNGRTAAPW